ncbi:MAG: Na+/H+ antiporter subunit E [Bauldia sp.]
MRVLSLALVLFVFWLLLSGHFTPFLVISGAVAAILTAALGLRLGYSDEEGHPIELLPRGLLYWPWLVKEAALSALSVARVILDPRLPISPRLVRVNTTQRGAVGYVTYANSITLTPGTITVEADRPTGTLVVHALTEAAAQGLRSGEMDRRVTAMEGSG